MSLTRLPLLISLLALLSPALSSASTAPVTASDVACLQLAQQGTLSAQQAAEIAQKKYGGRVLKIKPDGKVYRIKLLLDSGRVIQVTVDADSGALSKT